MDIGSATNNGNYYMEVITGSNQCNWMGRLVQTGHASESASLCPLPDEDRLSQHKKHGINVA